MKIVVKLLILAVLVGVGPSIAAQSLGEVAKREKKRREEVRKSGKSGRVLSEADLIRGEDEAEIPAEPDQTQASSATTSGESEVLMETDITLDSSIPPDAPLPERNRIFDRMKQLYEQEVVNIDVTIRSNELRLTEIERELSALGAGGLPVATTATQATTPTSGMEFQPLMDERKALGEQNEGLARRKEELKRTLLEKGRRGGIAAGRLRF